MKDSIKRFISRQYVFLIAALAAVVSCFLVPPDAGYLAYLDFKTLANLFCMMLVIAGLQNTGVLQNTAHSLIVGLRNVRMMTFGLVFITFVSSIFIANDMALLTFLPLTIVVLRMSGQQRRAAYVFVLQNIAANLGGMLTPFGNPQNIYLFNYYQIPVGQFFQIMAPLFAASILVLFGFSMLPKKDRLTLYLETENKLNRAKLGLLIAMFVLSILIVFSFINYWVGLGIVVAVVLVADRKAFLGVDYGLLLTFAAFFIFTSNLSRIPAVDRFIAGMVTGRELWVGIGLTQLISNVPTALLLSKFVSAWPPLLIAVNIGSFGTIVSSLASLITLKTYAREYGGSIWRYLGLFTLLNLSFLVALSGLALVILALL